MALFDSYVESNQDAFDAVYTGVGYQGIGQSITAAASSGLTQAQFYLKTTGAPTGNITANLYAHSGTFGSSSVPTGAALATSTAIDITTISTTVSLVTFVFPTPYVMTAGTNYVLTVEYNSGSGSNFLSVGVDTSSPTHGGNKSRLFSSAWSAVATSDTVFYAYDNAVVQSESSTVTDSPGYYTDLIATRESYSVSIASGGVSDDSINVNDTIGTSESLTLMVESYINKNDTIGSAESTQMMVESYTNKSDTIGSSDTPTVFSDENINKSDATTLTESIGRMADENISVNDATTLTENPVVLIPFYLINVTDTINSAESYKVEANNFITVSDPVSVAEVVFRMVENFISVTDTIGSSESVPTPTVSYQINVNDTVGTSESWSVAVTSGADLNINVNDSSTVTENVVLLIPFLLITTNDSSTVTENIPTPAIIFSVDREPAVYQDGKGVVVV